MAANPSGSAAVLPPLSDGEIDRLLATVRLNAHLATVSPAQRPQVAAVWYWWDRPTAWIVTFRNAARTQNLAQNAAVALSVDLNRFPAVGATIAGNARLVDRDAGIIQRIVERYIPRPDVQSFVTRYMADPNRVLLAIDATSVKGWDATRRPAWAASSDEEHA